MPNDLTISGAAFVQPPPTSQMTIAGQNAAVMPVSFGYYPREGSRAVSVQYSWSAQTSYFEDLSQLVARGVETTIQGVYVDNSTVTQYVTLAVQGTGQVLIIPPYSQGLFPLFFTGVPGFTLSIPGVDPGVTRLQLLNVPPQAVGVWAGAPGGASTIGPFLPTAGGTVTGPLTLQGTTTVTAPLIWTATGGSTARSAQNRSADVANVLDFGADASGAADSTGAFNAAGATLNAKGQNKDIYVPPGQYRINNQITLVNGQCLFGDSRGSTQLFCDGSFNMAATSVILLASTTQSRDAGSTIAGLTITMVQNMSATLRSQMVLYPPVILAQANCGRWKLLHSRIEGANTGYSDGGNNVVFSWFDVELGAFGTGMLIGMGTTGPQDFCHVHGLHFWNFGLPFAVFGDGNSVCMHIGRCDSLNVEDCSNFCGQIIVDSAGSASTITHFTNLQLDGDPSSISFQGGLHHHIANIYSSAGTTRTAAAVTVNGSTQVAISNWYSHNTSPFPMFNVIAGELSVENAFIRHYVLNAPIGQTSNGNALLKVTTATIWASTSGSYSPALFVQGGGTSRLRLDNITVDNLGTVNGGTVVQFQSDTPGNMLGTMSVPSAWTFTMPAGSANTQPIYQGGLVVAGFSNPTQGQLDLTSINNSANAIESKIRFHGTFATGTDYGSYLAATLRAGFSAFSWTASYLNVWLTNAGNGAGSDANMIEVASFAPNGVTFYVATNAPGMYAGNSGSAGAAIQIQGASGNNLNLIYAVGNAIRWVAACDTATTYRIDRYNASGTYVDTPLAINPGNGQLYHQTLVGTASYANDAAAATGGVGVGQLYRNGSNVMIRIV